MRSKIYTHSKFKNPKATQYSICSKWYICNIRRTSKSKIWKFNFQNYSM